LNFYKTIEPHRFKKLPYKINLGFKKEKKSKEGSGLNYDLIQKASLVSFDASETH